MKKYDTFEEFKEQLIRYLKQECALKDDRSYWDVETSNVDGTFIGEMFDNPVRISILKQNNPEFTSMIDENEVKKEAEALYLEDLKRIEESDD